MDTQVQELRAAVASSSAELTACKERHNTEMMLLQKRLDGECCIVRCSCIAPFKVLFSRFFSLFFLFKK
jgi:hypothetical protein